MIVVRSGRKVAFIQAELDDFFGIRRSVKNYNLNNETEAKLIYLLFHPLEWRRLKKSLGKKENTAKKIQRHLCKVFAFRKKERREKDAHVKKEKEPTVQLNINYYAEGEKRIGIEEKPELPADILKRNQNHDSSQLVPESIIMQFGKSGDLEALCPFCKDTLEFRFEDLDRKTFKNTRICTSCESINRVSITIGNRFIFADFEKYHPEIAKQIRKIENDEQDEFGNPIYTYSFPNI